jgi:hypothetical protein
MCGDFDATAEMLRVIVKRAVLQPASRALIEYEARTIPKTPPNQQPTCLLSSFIDAPVYFSCYESPVTTY